MQSLPVSAVIDPRVDIKPRKEVVLTGSEVISYQQFQPNQVSNSSVQISCDPPSREIGVGRMPLVNATYSVTLSISGSTGGSPTIPFPDGTLGVRCNPYASTVSSQQISINNDIYAVSPLNQWVNALAHYLNDYNERYTVYSSSGSMLDQAQNYSDTFGTNRNPLVSASNNSYDQTRNDYWAGKGIIISNVSGNTKGSSSVTFTVNVTEPLMYLSPLSMGKHGYFDNALFGVDKMSYSATYASLARILSIDTSNIGCTISNTTVNLSSLQLLFTYFKPRQDAQIPRTIQYPYYSMVLYQTQSSIASVTPNLAIDITSNNIQLIGVPRKLYVWVSRPDKDFESSDGFKYTNTFFSINSVTLTWNTNQFLASCSKQDLYNISVKNRNRLTYSQWSDKMGSVICLDLAEDVGLPAGEAVGLNETVQMNLKVNATNTNQSLTITNPQLNILVVYDGIMTIGNGFASRNINNLNRSQILNAEIDPNLSYNQLQHMFGGNFFTDVGHFFTRTVPSALKKARDFVRPVATPVLNAVSGLVPAQYRLPFDVGRKITGLGKGRKMKGGSGMVSRSELKDNIDEFDME